jgi:hypothetical protein
MRQRFLQAVYLILGPASAFVTDEPFNLTTLIVSTSSAPRTEVTSIPVTLTSTATSAFVYTSTACITLFQNGKKPAPLCPTDADESAITSLSYRTDIITTIAESTNVIWDPVTLTQTSTIQTHHLITVQDSFSAPSAAASSLTGPSSSISAPTQLPSTQVDQFTSVGSVATLSVLTESGPVQKGNGVFTMTSTQYVSALAKNGRVLCGHVLSRLNFRAEPLRAKLDGSRSFYPWYCSSPLIAPYGFLSCVDRWKNDFRLSAPQPSTYCHLTPYLASGALYVRVTSVWGSV